MLCFLPGIAFCTCSAAEIAAIGGIVAAVGTAVAVVVKEIKDDSKKKKWSSLNHIHRQMRNR